MFVYIFRANSSIQYLMSSTIRVTIQKSKTVCSLFGFPEKKSGKRVENCAPFFLDFSAIARCSSQADNVPF